MSNNSVSATPEDRLGDLIRQRLRGRVALREFSVLVHDRGLILQGCAASYYAKQLAQHAAMEVSGRPIMANEINVE
jgi:osmotically-inducible protein OsmY